MHSRDLQYQPSLSSPAIAPALQPERVLGNRRAPVMERAKPVHELNVSGVRVLLGLGLAIGLAGLFLWGFVRDWLFAP